MSYIDNNLLPEERILFRTKKNIIIFFWPVVLAIFCFYTVGYMEQNPILQRIHWLPWLVVVAFFFSVFLEYKFSEFAVTNKRLMMREGFFIRHANEVRLNAISQVNIEQSLLGQLLNYGVVTINAFGATDMYTMIDKPFQFQKAVNQQMDAVTAPK